jgi:hypothetical protein
LIEAERALHLPALAQERLIAALLSDALRHRQELSLRAVLEALETLQGDPAVPGLVARLQRHSPLALHHLLEEGPWRDRLSPAVWTALTQPGPEPASCRLDESIQDTLHHLELLVQDRQPTLRAASLVLVARLDRARGSALAARLLTGEEAHLVRTTAEQLLALGGDPPILAAFPALEKRVCLSTCDFFRRTHADTLDALADGADLRTYSAGELITEAGDTCRELLLLIEGQASIRFQDGDGTRSEPLIPGQTLDELEVLTHSSSENTIVAERDQTRLLAVPVESFDAMLDRDPDFTRRVLELESRQLQRFMRSVRAPVDDAPAGCSQSDPSP